MMRERGFDRVLRQEKAFGEEGSKKLVNYGYVQFFRSGEYHHNSPLLMKTLHKVSETHAGHSRKDPSER